VAPVRATWRSRIVDRGEAAPADLVANPRNWREHPPAQRDALAGLLDQVGWVQDVVVNRRTGRLVDGHLRVELAKARGEPLVPVVYVDLAEDEEALVLASLDPLAAMATADPEKLSALLGDAKANDEALRAMLTQLGSRAGAAAAGLTDPDVVPEPPEEPVARHGDLWVLGDHRLLCGSAAVASDVARLLDGATPELMVTDPPYGVALDMEWRDRAGKNGLGPAEPSYMQRAEGHQNTTISGDDKADWSDAFALVPSLRVIYAWHASSFTVDVGAGLRRIGFDLRQMIVWRKPHFVLSRTHYHYQTEPCWYAVRAGESSRWIGARDQSNLWDAASPKQLMAGSKEEKFDHPTQKPLLCMETPVANHDFADVYEPFCGSGTTLIACERQRRRCFAMELDPKFCDVIVARWEAFTGRKAERVAAEVAA
jgi:DNA modification methylase